MILYSLRKRTKNNPPFRQSILKSCLHRNTVHHGIHSHPGQSHLLTQRNPEFIKSSLQFRIYLIPAFIFLLLRSSIIHNILIINFRNIQLRPARHFHSQPFPIGLQPKLKQPFRFFLFS